MVMVEVEVMGVVRVGALIEVLLPLQKSVGKETVLQEFKDL
jgi:hypothetical protein